MFEMTEAENNARGRGRGITLDQLQEERAAVQTVRPIRCKILVEICHTGYFVNELRIDRHAPLLLVVLLEGIIVDCSSSLTAWLLVHHFVLDHDNRVLQTVLINQIDAEKRFERLLVGCDDLKSLAILCEYGTAGDVTFNEYPAFHEAGIVLDYHVLAEPNSRKSSFSGQVDFTGSVRCAEGLQCEFHGVLLGAPGIFIPGGFGHWRQDKLEH